VKSTPTKPSGATGSASVHPAPATNTNVAPRPAWRRARVAVRWIATALLLAWLARTADWLSVGPTLAAASPTWILAAAFCYLASQFASVARWRHLVHSGGLAASFSRLLTAYFEGMFVNICLPTSIGGDVLKVLRIGGPRNKTIAATTVVADRAAGVVALITLLGFGIVLRFRDRLPAGTVPLTVIGFPILGTAAIIGIRRLLEHFARSVNAAGRLVRAIPLLTAAPWPRIVAWALIIQGLNIAAVAAAAEAIGATITLSGLLIATELASLATALPLSIAGVGIREATLPMLLAADGVPRSAAIALGITWSAIVLSVGIIGGLGHIVEQRRATRDAIKLRILDPRSATSDESEDTSSRRDPRKQSAAA
jgi:glycosyltransferase 2 family protein